MRSTPLTSASIGVATVSPTVLALAPGYVAVTCTVGGATSGYCAIGSCVSATPPTIRITIDKTLAKMGRSMKKWEITASPQGCHCGLGCGCRRCDGFDGIIDPRRLQAQRDDSVLR